MSRYADVKVGTKWIVLVMCLLCTGTASAARLVCFGDSVTEGYGVAESDKWCTRLGGINAGVGGNSTLDAVARFQADVLSRRPDVVTIMFGIGDASYGVSVAEYKKNLRSMVRQLKRRSVRVILMTSNVTMRLWLNALMQDYVRAVRDVARREDVTLVDNYQSFAEILTTGVRYNEMLMDEAHPNAYGHEIIFEAVKHHVR